MDSSCNKKKEKMKATKIKKTSIKKIIHLGANFLNINSDIQVILVLAFERKN
jgi:hypothetical protein